LLYLAFMYLTRAVRGLRRRLDPDRLRTKVLCGAVVALVLAVGAFSAVVLGRPTGESIGSVGSDRTSIVDPTSLRNGG
jgi:hypothetical protein